MHIIITNHMQTYNIVALVFLFVFAGCIQTKEVYTLNPDGSGKVTFESARPFEAAMMGDDGPNPQGHARMELGFTLKSSTGVEVWKDVSYEVTEDARLIIKGTAYFRDISALRIEGATESDSNNKVFKKLPDGSMELRLIDKEKAVQGPTANVLSNEELAKKIKTEKAKFENTKGMFMAMLTGMRIEKKFYLPGQLDEVTVFEKDIDNNMVSVLYDGDKILNAINDITQDDDWWKRQILASRNTEAGAPMLDFTENIFLDVAEQARASISGEMRPLFDYKAEVVAAKKEYPQIRKMLGMDDVPEVLPPARGGKLKSLRVGGIRMVYESDQTSGIRPLYSDRSYTISLIGEFSGSILEVRGVSVFKAEADNGDDMLAEQKTPPFMKLSQDKDTVVFNIDLLTPGDDVKWIKEISGELVYVAGEGTKTLDLGILELKSGSKSKILNTRIASIGEADWPKGSYKLDLNLFIDRNSIKRIRFIDTDGFELDLEEQGLSQLNNDLTISFRSRTKFPSEAQIIIETYDKIQEYTIPYELKNISLLGKPMGPEVIK